MGVQNEFLICKPPFESMNIAPLKYSVLHGKPSFVQHDIQKGL